MNGRCGSASPHERQGLAGGDGGRPGALVEDGVPAAAAQGGAELVGVAHVLGVQQPARVLQARAHRLRARERDVDQQGFEGLSRHTLYIGCGRAPLT
jgi:hypothetical protein